MLNDVIEALERHLNFRGTPHEGALPMLALLVPMGDEIRLEHTVDAWVVSPVTADPTQEYVVDEDGHTSFPARDAALAIMEVHDEMVSHQRRTERKAHAREQVFF